jgi:hypothetical protein
MRGCLETGSPPGAVVDSSAAHTDQDKHNYGPLRSRCGLRWLTDLTHPLRVLPVLVGGERAGSLRAVPYLPPLAVIIGGRVGPRIIPERWQEHLFSATPLAVRLLLKPQIAVAGMGIHPALLCRTAQCAGQAD